MILNQPEDAMHAGLPEGVITFECYDCECFEVPQSSGLQLAAVLDAGRLFGQIIANAKLAVLHGDRAYAVNAIRLCGDLTAVVRRLGGLSEERDRLEALAGHFLLDLRDELAPSNLDFRRGFAIETVAFDEELDALGSPYDERRIGNWAIATVNAICAEFGSALRTRLPRDSQSWLDFTLHVQDALDPQGILPFVFPVDQSLVQWCSNNKTTDNGVEHWLSAGMSHYIPPQPIELSNEPVDYSWLQLTLQRAQELGVGDLDVLRSAGDSLRRSQAVEMVFEVVFRRLISQESHGLKDASSSDFDVSASRSGEAAVRGPTEPYGRSSSVSAKMSSGQSESAVTTTFASIFDVEVDKNRKSLHRRKGRKEVRFMRKDKVPWQLAQYMLNASAAGRSLADIQTSWKQLGGKEKPSKRTVENKMSDVNRYLEQIELCIERPQHNGAFVIVPLSGLHVRQLGNS
jgi:hypothetical protein